MNRKAGRIDLIFGPMFSGKSTTLQLKVRRHTIASKKCLLVNYIKDSRYSFEDVISTHDGHTLKALKCEKLEEILSIYQEYDVIAIDEAQFFSEIVEICEKLANEGKHVIVAALDGTFQRKPFGRVLELVPIAESVTKLTAVCLLCGGEACFTQRTVESQEIELIGGHDIYRPVCRSCFLKSENKKTAACSNTKESPKSEKSGEETEVGDKKIVELAEKKEEIVIAGPIKLS